MIPYALALEFAGYVHAHFIIEGNENLLAVGDGGCALGPGQMHPSFFAQYYGHATRFSVSVSDTWERAWVKTAAAFYDRNLTMLGSLDLTVQAYQEGVQAVLNGARNPEYLARWLAAMAVVNPAWNHP